MSGALKDQKNKVPVELTPPALIEAAARAFEYGVRKYAKWNWRLGREWSAWYGGLLRHLFAWFHGEDLDPESGLHHLDHAAANLAMLTDYVKNTLGEDDRPVLDRQDADHPVEGLWCVESDMTGAMTLMSAQGYDRALELAAEIRARNPDAKIRIYQRYG